MVTKWTILSDEQRRARDITGIPSGLVAVSGFRSCTFSKKGEIDTAADKKGCDHVRSPNIISMQTVQEEQRAILLMGSYSWHPTPSLGFHGTVRKKIMYYVRLVGNRRCETINNSVDQDIKLPGVISELIRFPGLQQKLPVQSDSLGNPQLMHRFLGT